MSYLLFVYSEDCSLPLAVDDLARHFPQLRIEDIAISAVRANPTLLQARAAAAEAVVTVPKHQEEVRSLCAELADVVSYPLLPADVIRR